MTDNKTREQIQAEMQLAEKRQKRTALLKRIGLWGGMVIVLVGMVWGLSYMASTPSGVASGDLRDAVTGADWQKGDPKSKVVIVEYSDFQCPYCKVYQSYIKDVLSKYGDKILFVYRNYPLTQAHEHAYLAAQAAEAAGLQGKYWEMHDKLFDTQADWEHSPTAQAMFNSYAQELGLDTARFATDMNSKAVSDKISRDVTSGDAANVQATPTFYLNGKKLTLQAYADLEPAVSAALK